MFVVPNFCTVTRSALSGVLFIVGMFVEIQGVTTSDSFYLQSNYLLCGSTFRNCIDSCNIIMVG
jgi:hypothetical protein